MGDGINLTFDPLTQKVTTHVKKGYMLALLKPLTFIFGFGNEEPTMTKTTESPYVADLTTISTIYVYCTATSLNLKSLETRALNYSKAFLPKESLVTLLRKRLSTPSTYRSVRNRLKTWKFF